MRYLLIFLPIVLLAQTPAANPTTDDEKTIYALGLAVYRNLAQFDLSPAEMALVKQALSDAQAGKPAVDVNTWGPKIQAMFLNELRQFRKCGFHELTGERSLVQ